MEQLTIGYRTNSTVNFLLENLNLSLYAGELVCLMGPNGIGKSTLIRTLAGLQKPLSGNINLFSGAMASTRENIISVVLTDRIVAGEMTVEELVTYGRYPFLGWSIHLTKEDQAAIDHAIEIVNIRHLVSKKLFELSDGQKQMTMIARALAQETPILLLDEPTAHLDLNNRLEIMKLLRSICRTTGKAILMATHELDLALQTADLIWLTTFSRTIKSGIPEDLVLDDSFDEVFQFKGYDLKTGKVNHEAHRGVSINLRGQGHEQLWTKNALERNGFEISPMGKIEIDVAREGGLTWTLSDGKKFESLFSLLEELRKISD